MPTKAMEQTLLILKPDAVQRGLIGEIFEHFETIGLKLMAAKMVMPDKKVIEGHYPGTREWIEEMGKKTLASYKDAGVDIVAERGTDDPYKLGQFLYERLIKYWQEGPVVVSVWEGPHAVQVARKTRGHTIPLLAETGTLHAKYLYDSSSHSASLDRVVKTFIHASGSAEEAQKEIKYWFGDTKFKEYKREVDKLYL
jgi:nucleoside-diphosphate kinase